MLLPREVGVMTLTEATLFPNALLPLYIFETRYRRMLADALETHRLLCVAMQKPGCTRETPLPVAGLGLIRVSVQHADGSSHLVLQGLCRVELQATVRYRPYRVQAMRELAPGPCDTPAVEALVARVRELMAERLELGLPGPLHALGIGQPDAVVKAPPQVAREMLKYVTALKNPEHVVDMVTSTLIRCAQQRQAILATVELEPRLRQLVRFLLADIRRQREDPAP
jgi:ATP-dependent Lon protease